MDRSGFRPHPRPTPITLVASLFSLLLVLPADVTRAAEIPFDSPRWAFRAAEWRLEEHLGRPSLYLRDGFGWIDGLSLTDGTVEFDIAFTAERGFAGAAFRMQDTNDYENFYLRPHQSGQPDANQYTPVFHGVAGWQLYHGAGYSAPTVYPYDTWIHVRIAFSGDRAEVYIDSQQPSVVIPELKRERQAGTVGLTAFLADVHFSNFRYGDEVPVLRGTPEVVPEAPDGVVLSWQVSAPFAEKEMVGLTTLPEEFASTLEWRGLAAESTGITNLARISSLSPETNTVWVRWPQDVGSRQRVRFGYSDRVRVFCNGRLLYSGSNLYRSRDFRYLGTIGLFDEIRCPAENGRNDVLFAVSESFGGWGILAVAFSE
jgi:hypothetical protein